MAYAIVKHTDNPITLDSIKKRWGQLPGSLTLPNGRRLVSPVQEQHIGMEYEEFRFVQVEQVDWSPPTPADVKVGITVELVGGLLTLIKVWRTRTQQEIDDNNAELRQEDIDDYLSDKSTTIVFELAKQIIPGLTKGQFSTFVHNKWPII